MSYKQETNAVMSDNAIDQIVNSSAGDLPVLEKEETDSLLEEETLVNLPQWKM